MTTRKERDRWMEALRQVQFIANAMTRNLDAAPSARLTPAFVRDLRGLAYGDLIRMYDDRSFDRESPLGEAVHDPVEACRILLSRNDVSKDQVIADGTSILLSVGLAISQLKDLKLTMERETVEEVVDELERDYLVSLTVTLTGHAVIVTKLAEWSRGGGEYLDVPSLTLAPSDGPGRVHMKYVNDALDGGIATFVIGQGFQTYDRFPQLQYMLYSQWFTYIFDLWDEHYRDRLARAHGLAPDGEPWGRSDIRNPFFGDIRNIRRDIVHKRGIAHDSADNTILTWFTEDERLKMNENQMISLATLFPREQLLQTPTKAAPGQPTQVPWQVAPEVVDQVKRRIEELNLSRKQKNQISNQALRLWLEANASDAG